MCIYVPDLVRMGGNMSKEKGCKMTYLKYDLQLFAKDGDGGEKTEEPTAKKLQDARKKGQAARSQDLTMAISLFVFFIMLRLYVGTLGNSFLENYNSFYSHITDVTNMEVTIPYISSLVGDVIKRILRMVAPFLLVSMFVTIVSVERQVKWKVSTEPMKPQLNKFNPVSGVKRMFSKSNLMKLLFSIAKIMIIIWVIYDYLRDKWTLVMDMYFYTLPQAIALIVDVIINIGLRISFFFLAIGIADYFYQKWKFHEDMKMTKQEVKDEYKNAEGDPKVKSQQRRRMMQASQRRMMAELPQADVVITNPTHLAVAIKYDKDKYDAPVVLAKGADYLAERIKEVAR
ncbi:MAG: EscU/YscU/HrcU family type III secretion system export apparatus switch protein, partial [Lachnospiraceae bacterium]|nr:EscU/YscU/HrcU family type III secretion system export apparatus switch protein [Lachnospiraceae bacterium]